jgi:Ca2+-transporting ATPase
MVVARKDFDPQTFDPKGKLIELVTDLTLLAMVGIVDPPRPEAKVAIAKCKSAGIQVRMITGDHAVTAAAIGHELGITGKALTGAEFKAMSDEELSKQLPEIGVVARVAPEDKIRLVDMLQKQSNIVAMTGDGVNDAPALKKADIGVAMGITGTEVSKGAAVMILTDDNFATIVKAVEYGRGIYENLAKYIRFQMTALVAFIISYLGASLLFIAGGVPFGPLVVLWINFLIQVPIAIALGFDKPEPGLMERKPRPLSQPVLSRSQWVRIIFMGMLMAVGTLWLESRYEQQNPALMASVAMVVFSLFNIVIGLSNRSETKTAFNREIFADRRQLMLYGIALGLTFVGTQVSFLQRLLGTADLPLNEWLICIAAAVILLLIDEIVKFFLRRRRGKSAEAQPVVDVTQTNQPSIA